MKKLSKRIRNSFTSVIDNLNELTKKLFHSTLGINIISLYILQFANYIVPLILIPYLVRVLTPKGYGIISFIISFVSYFTTLVDYGFYTSAVRKISVNRGNINKVRYINSSVWLAKLALFIASFIIILITSSIILQLQNYRLLVIIVFISLLGNVLFPQWLFQGLEKMFISSVISLAVRILFLVPVFIFVKSPNDIMNYAIIFSLSPIVSGITGAIVALSHLKISFVLPKPKFIWFELKHGFPLFLSSLFVGIYVVGNPFLLGLFATSTSVGYYTAAEKIVRSISIIISPLSSAFFPRFSKLMYTSREHSLDKGSKAILLMISAGFIISLFIFIFSPIIVNVLFGEEYLASEPVMRIMSILPLLITFNISISSVIVMPIRKDKEYLYTSSLAALVNIFLGIMLTPSLKEIGMAIAVVFAELTVSISMIYILYINNINIFRKFTKK